MLRAAANSPVLHRRHWLNPMWWRRRRILAAARFQHDRAGSARDASTITAHLNGQEIGGVDYQTCTDCRRSLICKISIDDECQGYGIGARLIDAVLAAGPSAGYAWYTTPQNSTARGFWRSMSRRHQTPFTDDGDGPCAHMNV